MKMTDRTKFLAIFSIVCFLLLIYFLDHDETTTTLVPNKKNHDNEETTTDRKREKKQQYQEEEQQNSVETRRRNNNNDDDDGKKKRITPAANRVPYFSSLLKVSPHKQHHHLQQFQQNYGIVECFDRTLSQTRTPNFISEFFSPAHITRQEYNDLLRHTETNPNAILHAWIPQRFMAPQKPGKKANGQIMIPPTRGRDPEFYIKEYNASFVAKFSSGDVSSSSSSSRGPLTYIQLMHKNALAVCVRERIHIQVRRCRPTAWKDAKPILISSCLCRKCEEKLLTATPDQTPVEEIRKLFTSSSSSTSAATATATGEFLFLPSSILSNPQVQTLLKLKLEYPNFASLMYPSTSTSSEEKREGEDYEQKKGGGGSEECQRMLSAPWLVPKSVHSKFDYEGLENDLDSLLRIQSQKQGLKVRNVMIVIFNKWWVDHLENFVFSLVSRAKVTSFIVATMDEDSAALCRHLRLPCFDATEFAEREDDEALRTAGHKRKVTEAMSWIKPRLAVAVLGRGYGFWMVDLDMTFGKNPFPFMHRKGQQPLDLVHQCDSPARYSINSGFYDATPSLSSFLFFNNLMTFTPDENSDQTAMRLFARYDHSHGLTNECLNKWIFDMKCNYKVSGSVKLQHGVETFEWIPIERDRKKQKFVLHHATCISGAQRKIQYLRTAVNAWLLDDLDEWSNRTLLSKSKKRCWILDGDDRDQHRGVKVINEEASSSGSSSFGKPFEVSSSPHSAKYPRDGGEEFLLKRH